MMQGLTVDNIHLDEVLHPVAYYLDNCWWYLGGHGMSFPSIRPPARVEAPKGAKLKGVSQFDPADWQRFLDESSGNSREYANWLIDDEAVGRIGKLGFFSRYARGMDSDWSMHCASDAATPNSVSFAAFSDRFDRDWFGQPPADLPHDICLITRVIDAGYLDLFFRDDWMFKAVWSFCQGKGMNPRLFERPKLGDTRS